MRCRHRIREAATFGPVLCSLAVVLVVSAVPRVSHAVPVGITYTLGPGSFNQLGTFLAGAGIAGMSASVTASLPTLNAISPTGPVILNSFKVTGTNGSTFLLTPIAVNLTPGAQWATRFFPSVVPTTPIFTNLYAKRTLVFDWFRPPPVAGKTMYFQASQRGTTVSGGPLVARRVIVFGTEVGRTVVPEPNTAALLGLGLLVLSTWGGGAALARRGRRR